MSKGTVKITETIEGGAGAVKFEITWPSGKVFTKYVGLNDDVNERRAQQRFAQERGYEVEHNGVMCYNSYRQV
jgi:hypothetical protein